MGTETQAHLRSLIDEYQTMRSRVEALNTQLAEMTATARSADHSVTATVGPQGALVSLTLDPSRAARLDLTTLASRIVEAATLAGSRIRERVGAEVADLLPSQLRHLVGPDGTVDVAGLLPDDPMMFGQIPGGRR